MSQFENQFNLKIIQFENLKMNFLSLLNTQYSNLILSFSKAFLLCILLFSFSNLLAQDFKKDYRKAKELFKDGKYSEAMDAFSPLTVYDKENPYTEYAFFYHALSAQRIGFTSIAKNQFRQLKKLYPRWPQIDEVNYWLATIYFQQGEFFQAMKLLEVIQDNSFRSSQDSLKQAYLSKIKDVELLKMIGEDHPTDLEVARALATAIGRKGLPNEDIHLLDSITIQYNWRREDFMVIPPSRVRLKDRYRISLLFPFRAATLEPTPERKKNQQILELYQGMKLAVDSLAKTGVNVDLVAYDTDRNLETIQSLLSKPELKSSDLIIGPLFADEAKPVQSFSKENQINLIVNPVSSNSDFLKDNPNALLFQPSHETIGRKSAEWMAGKLKKKNCLVYYSDSPKDSVMAFNFIKRALELGIDVVYAEEVRKEKSAKILETLAKATQYDEFRNPTQFKLKKDSLGGIFVAAPDSPLIYTKVINSVETRGDSILVIGQEDWLEDNSLDYVKLERTQVVLASPNFTPFSGTAFSKFRKAFFDKHGILPSENSMKGYELMFVIGKAMNEYGTYFTDGLLTNGKPFPGVLTDGFWLQPSRDNGQISFISFSKGELKRL
jgi:ABC-type branched-subunit amino acid transport system substrate-binding protein/outer membrane protein assembly factor BamD (BamD/ComL family)